MRYDEQQKAKTARRLLPAALYICFVCISATSLGGVSEIVVYKLMITVRKAMTLNLLLGTHGQGLDRRSKVCRLYHGIMHSQNPSPANSRPLCI